MREAEEALWRSKEVGRGRVEMERRRNGRESRRVLEHLRIHNSFLALSDTFEHELSTISSGRDRDPP